MVIKALYEFRGVVLDGTIVTLLCLFGVCASRGRRGQIVLGIFSLALFGGAGA